MSNPSSSQDQPRLLSFSLDGWDVLGDRISVSLQDGVAVLVGRNGAGKSAILEGFKGFASLARGVWQRVSQNDIDSIPKILNIKVLTPTNRQLEYKYELITLAISDEENQFSWNDCCQYLDGKKEVLWNMQVGETTYSTL